MTILPEADIKKVTWSSDVYEPSDDSFALVDAVNEYLRLLVRQPASQLPKICVEVGCGSGYVICSAALALRQLQVELSAAPAAATGPSCCFFATDMNGSALEATAKTLEAHGVFGVELIQTDLVQALMPHIAGAVDLLLFNPPYVPTPDEEVLRPGIARAWAGGQFGRRVTDRLLAQLPELLSPAGHAFIVTVPENKPQEIINNLRSSGLADEECLKILHVKRGGSSTNDTSR